MTPPTPRSPPPWLTPLVFFVLAAAWTWPALLGTHLLGHHPDAPGTAWFLSAAPRLLSHGLSDPLTGWPDGAHYGRPDSFLLLPIGLLSGVFSATRLLGWTTVVGVTLSAWGAEALARQLGARAPWSWLAGFAFAFSGLAATAQLEGYPYHLVNPWVPLFVAATLRATLPGGTPRDGALAGLWFVLALLSTAWLGIVCIPLALVLGVAALTDGRREVLRNVAAGALVVLPLALAYVWLFRAGGGAGSEALADAGFPTPDLGLTLRRYAPPGPSIDLHSYTQSATLPAVALALSVVAGRLIPSTLPWRRVLAAGVAALGMALAPAVLAPLTAALAQLDDTVLSVVASAVLRFPDRLTWGTLVCFGAVAAVSLTHLADRHPRVAASVLVLALVDAFAVPRLPFRQQRMLAEVPSAYAAHDGPVLDIWPEDASPAPAWTLWTTNLACYYQTVHARPIADLCIVSPGVESPRLKLQAHILDRWLTGRADETLPELQAAGFGSVVVHTTAMAPEDRARMLAAVAGWPGEVVRTTDGGEEVFAVGIPR